jgi:hypothetical protein
MESFSNKMIRSINARIDELKDMDINVVTATDGIAREYGLPREEAKMIVEKAYGYIK